MASPHIPTECNHYRPSDPHSHSTASLCSLSLQKINLAVADSHPRQTAGSCRWSPIHEGASRCQFLPQGPQGSGVCPHIHVTAHLSHLGANGYRLNRLPRGISKKGETEHTVNTELHFPQGLAVQLENNNELDNTTNHG